MKKIKGTRDPTPTPKASAKAGAKAKAKKDRGRSASEKPEGGKSRYPKIGKPYCWTFYNRGKCAADEKGECKRGEHIPADEVQKLAAAFKASKDAAPAAPGKKK